MNYDLIEKLLTLAIKGEPTAKPACGEMPVLVTTAHRGVFFGYTCDPRAEIIELKRARLCTYWSKAMKGFTGLANEGPDSGCRIGAAVPVLRLRNITSVSDVTTEAAKKWEAAPWQ